MISIFMAKNIQFKVGYSVFLIKQPEELDSRAVSSGLIPLFSPLIKRLYYHRIKHNQKIIKTDFLSRFFKECLAYVSFNKNIFIFIDNSITKKFNERIKKLLVNLEVKKFYKVFAVKIMYVLIFFKQKQ
ncbi:hypothetical protein BpHYR1_023959 [Brachionus plicatilis]|uniref:Uncharacterized protein n=1 Tax=Brachionus plicatilis TaxID=10195 RepID=A0A3M7SPZ4_BRAPC|nr:hypothetical protein BpHYR1_023959 [Brachionus plicatilis]